MTTCYLQTNRGDHCQETYETAARAAGKRARQLRQHGYLAIVSPLGPQATRVGTVKLTMVDIRPGNNADTFDLPTEDWALARL